MNTLLLTVYVVCSLVVSLYILAYLVILVIYLTRQRTDHPTPSVNDSQLPAVTIQIPLYNEAYVAERVIRACVQLDYPADKLIIQVLDDSTDNTQQIITDLQTELNNPHLEIIHREKRTGYKAGALESAPVKTPFVLIFDADFIPPPDFLRRTMPHFHNNPQLAMIQTRWSHLNPNTNWLTRIQAMNIDAHFAVEQVARYRGNLPMSMNGTGAIWRVSAIQDSGGWHTDTLTEDLDLSYRAQMKGYQFLYLRDVAVPGELTPQLQAYKVQQARWATGSTQCLIKHAPALLSSPRHSVLQKFMGIMHLSQYLIQPVLLLLFLLTPYLIATQHSLPTIKALSVMGIIPPLVIVIGQMALYDTWYKRLIYFPAQLVIGAGIIVSNSLAVFKALKAGGWVFERTPKFQLSQTANSWRTNHYRLKFDRLIVPEALLLLYSIWGLFVANANEFYAFVPYMLIHVVSFSYFVLLGLYDAQ
jgi:cellulose synthase/poly-beta-1,6-N-acetylglucosamine synthase-like glycosyltransferase